MNKKFVEVEILLSEVQRMANEISSNKTQLLDKLEDLEGIADQHEVNASVIANTTRHAQRYTSQSMRMMALILNVEWILRNHTTAIKNQFVSFYEWKIVCKKKTLRRSSVFFVPKYFGGSSNTTTSVLHHLSQTSNQ